MGLFKFIKEKQLERSIDDLLGADQHVSEKQADALCDKAIELIYEYHAASASFLQRRLSISFENANYILDKLELNGVISPFDGKNPRQILLPDEASAKRAVLGFAGAPTLTDEVSHIDSMEGHEFEYWCAELLRNLGFVDVGVTPGSGDQGVDILAKKDGIKYAIQCKCYSSDLGNKPIQEVHAGKAMYNCHVGAVMTNRSFTAGGKQLAEATGVLLWDRNWIIKALEIQK